MYVDSNGLQKSGKCKGAKLGSAPSTHALPVFLPPPRPGAFPERKLGAGYLESHLAPLEIRLLEREEEKYNNNI